MMGRNEHPLDLLTKTHAGIRNFATMKFIKWEKLLGFTFQNVFITLPNVF